jgi:hypothetical protein
MKYLKTDAAMMDMDSGEDARESTALLENQLELLRARLAEQLPAARAALLIEIAHTLLHLERNGEAHEAARAAFDLCLGVADWETGIQALEALFLSGQADAFAALGQAIWLAVTYPVDPELTVAVLQHVIDETPADSDGAAIAATVAHYVADLRTPEGKGRENLMFYTNQMLATVARRHGDVHDQAAFDRWFQRLELDDPERFLVRLRNIVDVLVQDDWWIDRDSLRAAQPDQ